MPFYILHQTIILVIGFYIIGRGLSIMVKYLIISTGSILLIMVLYELLINRINIFRFLFGMKLKKHSTSLMTA